MPPRFPHQYQGAVLRIPLTPFSYLYGTITLYRMVFQPTLSQKRGGKRGPQHHISIVFLRRIQFELCRFRSLLLTASLCFLFLQVLRRFNSLRSPTRMVSMEKSHSEILGSTFTCNSPKHFVACHVLHRRFEPSHPSSSVPKIPKIC